MADGGGCVTLGPDSTEVTHGALVERRAAESLPRGEVPKDVDAHALGSVAKVFNNLFAELRAFLDGKVAKWWIPHDVVFTDKIPLGSTGKINEVLLLRR